MSDFEIIEHGSASVVTCKGYYEGSQASITLKFMRVWLKKNGHWQIIAGTTSSLIPPTLLRLGAANFRTRQPKQVCA